MSHTKQVLPALHSVAAVIVLMWFVVAVDKWKGPMSGITAVKIVWAAAVKLCLDVIYLLNI